MTRDGTVGRSDATETNLAYSLGRRSRSSDEASVREPHQGQQSIRTASTGRTHDCKRLLRCTPKDLLQGGGHPHMRDSRGTGDHLLSPIPAHPAIPLSMSG